METNSDWKIYNEYSFTDKNLRDPDVKKNVFDYFFHLRNQSKPEKNFIKKLEKSPKVKWWHKNGDSGVDNFAVP